MKAIIRSSHVMLAVAALMLFVRPTFAQDGYLGVYSGINFATASTDEDISLNSRKGLVAGARFELALTDWLSARLGAEYTQAGSGYTVSTPGVSEQNGVMKFDYLTLPIQLKAGLKLSKSTPYAFFGFTPAAVVAAKRTIDGSSDEDVQDKLNGGDLTFDLGAGIAITPDSTWVPSIEATYSYGLLNQAKTQGTEILNASSWKARNLKVVLGLAYKIF